MREIVLANGMTIGLLDEEEMAPSHPNPLAVGDRVRVTGTLTTTNSAGGTAILRVPKGGIACEVTKTWYDYETGYRYHGRPAHEADAANIRQQALSEYGPDWHRENRPDDVDGLRRAEEALARWDPGTVYFSEHDVRLDTVVRTI